MKRVLIYYNFSYPPGGGDYLLFSFLEELQDTCEITLAVDSEAGFERSAVLFGYHAGHPNIKVVQVMPRGYAVSKHNMFHSLYRFRHLSRLARKADVCISACNVIDFGRPGHHFINVVGFGDQTFSDSVKHKKMTFRQKIRCRADEFILRPIVGMRSKSAIIQDPREHIYPNSLYVERVMKEHFGDFGCTVFYPPTTFRCPASGMKRDPLRVVYIGRINPGKRIYDIIDIVSRARDLSGEEINFHIAGPLNKEDVYTKKLIRTALDKPWIVLAGGMYGKDKEEFLLSGTYAVHAEQDESFGISITEYLKAGCIPIVPDEGGTPEIVDTPALVYHTNEDAAEILTRLLKDGAFRQEQLNHCKERANAFSCDHYMESQHKILETILEKQI